MNTRSTKLKTFGWVLVSFSSILLSLVLILTISSFANAASKSKGLDEDQLKKFSQNNILFYDPSDCIGGTSSGVCGDTAEEKIWSILRQTLDPIHAAAAFGSIANEGGFQPVKWEYGNVVSLSTCNFVVSWDDLYSGVYDGRYGVGSFGLTSGLSDYLHYINDNEPDLLQYFKDPSNTCLSTGDDLAEKIGESEYDRLIELEVNYFINNWISESKLEEFKSITDLEEAAIYWAHDIEVCAACGYNAGSSQLTIRAAAAQGYYDQYKDFTCSSSSKSKSSISSSSKSSSSSSSSSSNSSGSSSSSSTSDSSSGSTVSGSDITWIGDSYSVQADNKGLLSEKFSGVDIGSGSNNTSSSYIQGSKFVSSGPGSNPPCLDILQNIIDASELRPYLVFACGTNGGWSDDDITEFQDLLSGLDTKAIVVTSKTPKNDYSDSNDRLKKMAESNDNIYLADWTTVYDESYFDGDSEKIHPVTDPGYEKWVGVIEDALSSASGEDCTTYEGDYPQYDQCGDSRWSNYSYSTDNICGSGCGAASMAMLATVATGQDIFPDDIADLLGNQYYDQVSLATLDPIVGEHYGFDVEVVNTSGVEDAKTKMRDYLQKGYMIHFTGAGCYPGFIYASGGCTPGHVIGLFDIDSNDMVTQANSGMGEVHQKASLDDMANALIWGVFTAIKGGNGSKNSCGNICKNSNTSVSMDGLTEEQAQKVADYYNSSEVTSSNFIGGFIPSDYGKVNCVSFSLWFVSAFTDAAEISPTPSLVGDGSYIADTGLPSIGWETGNDPTPYSVFGGAGSSAWSHTGVVVGTTDDGDILTIEAAYGLYDARVMTKPASYFSEGVGILAYPSDHFTPNEGHLGNKSLKEIIGN